MPFEQAMNLAGRNFSDFDCRIPPAAAFCKQSPVMVQVNGKSAVELIDLSEFPIIKGDYFDMSRIGHRQDFAISTERHGFGEINPHLHSADDLPVRGVRDDSLLSTPRRHQIQIGIESDTTRPRTSGATGIDLPLPHQSAGGAIPFRNITAEIPSFNFSPVCI